MKKIIILFSLSLVIVFSTAAQPSFAWAKRMGGSGPAIANSITRDGSGIMTTGTFQGTVDFDPGAGVYNLVSAGSADIFISKLDLSGNFLWAKRIGGVNPETATGISVDFNGNIVITGYFQFTIDFDPGAATFNMTSFGANDIFVCKLDMAGNFIWAKQLGGFYDDYGYSVSFGPGGDVFATGQFNGTADFDPNAGTFNLSTSGISISGIFVSKLDPSGNFVLAKQIGGNPSPEFAYCIKPDINNNIYITGVLQGTADMDPGPGVVTFTCFGGYDVFVEKLNSVGSFVWAKQMGGPSFDLGWCLDVDLSGNVYSTGYFQGTADFDPGAGVFNLTSAGANDVFVSKLDVSGNFLWAKAMGGPGNDIGWGLDVDAFGNAYTTGSFKGTSDFDPGASVANLICPGTDEVFISKLDASGNFGWAVQLNGTASSDNFGKSILVDGGGNVFTTGYFYSTVDFDPGAATFSITSTAGADIFVHKLAQCTAPSQPGAISGSTAVCAGSGAVIYSVAPVSGATSYTWSLPGGWSGTSSTNTISATPGSSGVFSVTATNSCATSPAQTLSITANSTPTISVNSGVICSGQSFTILPNGANSYTFSGGSAVVSPTATTSYSVTGTSTAGCVSSAAAVSNVTVNPLPNVSASTANTIICGPPFQQTVTLTASGATTYTWSSGPNSLTIAVSPSVTTQYTVTGTNANGCVNSFVITQSVSTCADVTSSAVETPAIKIFPNPSNGQFTLICSGKGTSCLADGGKLLVYSALGQKIMERDLISEGTELDLSHISNGIYLLYVHSQKSSYHQILIKQ